MNNHVIIAILIFGILLVWHLDFSYGFMGAGLLGLVHIVSFLLIPILLFASVSRKKIKRTLVLLIYFASILLSLNLSFRVELSKIQNTEKRGNIIVSAIEEYRKDKGKYPDDLLELTPKYLDNVPKTSMGILTFQSFLYEIDRDSNTYALSFACPTFIIGEYSSKTGTWQYDD